MLSIFYRHVAERLNQFAHTLVAAVVGLLNLQTNFENFLNSLAEDDEIKIDDTFQVQKKILTPINNEWTNESALPWRAKWSSLNMQTNAKNRLTSRK